MSVSRYEIYNFLWIEDSRDPRILNSQEKKTIELIKKENPFHPSTNQQNRSSTDVVYTSAVNPKVLYTL